MYQEYTSMYQEGTSLYQESTSMYQEGTSLYQENISLYHKGTTKIVLICTLRVLVCIKRVQLCTKQVQTCISRYISTIPKGQEYMQKYMHVLDGNQASSLDKLGGLHLTRIGPSGMTQDSLTSNWLEWVSIDLTDRS